MANQQSGNGLAAVLEREAQGGQPPSSQTNPELEPAAGGARVGGAIQDSLITVIENPSLDLYIGILLAEHFRQDNLLTRLTNVEHIRFRYDPEVFRLQHYKAVSVEKGFSQNMAYHFVRTDFGNVLPAGSTPPYRICPITAAQYDEFHRSLKSGKDIKTVLSAMYGVFAGKVPGFSLSKDGMLVLPRNYASLRVQT